MSQKSGSQELGSARPLIAPSILASDWSQLREEVNQVCAGGADLLHLDVMDGSFVPPITFGADFVKAVKQASTVPLDVHLMIQNPENHLHAFAEAGAQYITVHVEACPHLHRTIQRIHELGVRAGIALNPGTPVSAIADVIAEADLVLIMSVDPGWGGQKFIPHSTKKIHDAKVLVERSGKPILIEVDGGVDDTTAKICVKSGAEILVSGSYIFKQKGNYQRAIASLR